MKKVELGDILVAISLCLMKGSRSASLTIGVEYKVIAVNSDVFTIINDQGKDHHFRLDNLNLYFKYKDATDKQVGGDHYKQLAIQPVEFIQRNGIKYCEANAIKYICRHRAKNGVQDIDKAIHYLELLKELEYSLSV